MSALLLSIPIFLIALLLFGFDIGAFPLISPDEPRYAETAREMIEQGNYIVPFCDYLPRFDKPILFYWFEVLAFKVFGVNEFAARIPSVIAGSGIVYLAFLLGNLHGIGLLSAAIIASSTAIFLFSKIAITDMTLCFFISGALVFFYLAYYEIVSQKQKFAFKERVSSKYLLISSLMMALGVLCKGPIAVVLPILVIIGFLIYKRNFKNFILDSWLELLIALVIFVIVSIPWYISVDLATKNSFTQDFFIDHNVNRFTAVHTNHSAPIWFYIPVILLGFFPWSFFLIQAFIKANSGKKFTLNSEDYKIRDTIAFSTIWSLVIFIFFTLAKTKLATYILPIFLPLGFITASFWNDKFKTNPTSKYKNLDALYGFLALFISLIVTLVILASSFKATLLKLNPTGFFVPIAVIGFILLSTIFICLTAILEKPKLSFILFTTSSLISLLIFTDAFLKPFAIQRDDGSKAFAKNIKEQIVTFAVRPTRFSFYSKKEVREFKTIRQLKRYLETHTKPIILITKPKSKVKILKQIPECKEFKSKSLQSKVHVAFKCQSDALVD